MSDHRTAADVVTTALQNVGDSSKDAAAAILAALEAENIQWAWQLSRLSAEQWTARLSVCTLGLQIAIQDALIDQPQQLGREVVLTPLLRNFLLLPAEDGSPPKRLNSLSAIFYSLLLTPVAERQAMLLAVCELLALINGLILAVPLSVMRTRMPPIDAPKGWDVWPTIDDGISTLGVAAFGTAFTAVILAAMIGILVASVGRFGGHLFYESVLPALVGVWTLFFVVMWMTIAQVVWHTITLSASPYLFFGLLLLGQGLNAVDALMFRCAAVGASLEVWHMPRWLRIFMHQSFAPLMKGDGGKSLVGEELLWPAAERRAAELRAHLGIVSLDTASSCSPQRRALG